MIKAGSLFSGVVAIGLTACTPHVSYIAVPTDNGEPDPANALRFTLQDASLTLAKPMPPSANSATGKALSSDSCSGTHAEKDTFNLCWAGVGPPIVVAVAKDDSGTYIAKP